MVPKFQFVKEHAFGVTRKAKCWRLAAHELNVEAMWSKPGWRPETCAMVQARPAQGCSQCSAGIEGNSRHREAFAHLVTPFSIVACTPPGSILEDSLLSHVLSLTGLWFPPPPPPLKRGLFVLYRVQ